MKYRYLVFGYDRYYPSGGMSDCILKTNDILEVEKLIDKNDEEDRYEFMDFFDCLKGEQ